MRFCTQSIAALGLSMSSGLAFAGPYVEYRTVVQIGDTLQGFSDETVADFEGYPVISDTGLVACALSLGVRGLSPVVSTLWLEDPDGLGLIAMDGDPLPGIAGLTISSLNDPVFGADGSLLFTSDVDGSDIDTGFNDALALWSFHDRERRLVSSLFTSPPGLPGLAVSPDDFFFFGSPRRYSGSAAFVGTSLPDEMGVKTNFTGVTTGVEESLLFGGSDEPVDLDGTRLLPPAGIPYANASGDAAFYVLTVGADEEPSEATVGLAMKAGESFRLILRDGAPAPVEQKGVVWGLDFRDGVSIGGAGHVAFRATLLGLPDVFLLKNSVWVSDPERLTEIARSGDRIDTTTNLVFRRFGIPVVNANGDVAFTAELAGIEPEPGMEATPASFGLFAYIGGNLRTIAIQGQPAPGRFGEEFFRFEGVRINDSGDIAFFADLSGEVGIWMYEAGVERVRFIASDFIIAEVNAPSGRFGFINDVGAIFQDSIEGRRFDLNNAGQVVFRAANAFRFRTGILVAEPVPGPICLADLNQNGVVDLGDFGAFGQSFGKSFEDPGYDIRADFDLDGFVGMRDFGAFAQEFGRGEGDCWPN